MGALEQTGCEVKSAPEEQAISIWSPDFKLLLSSLPSSLHLLASDGPSLLTSCVTSAVSVCVFVGAHEDTLALAENKILLIWIICTLLQRTVKIHDLCRSSQINP